MFVLLVVWFLSCCPSWQETHSQHKLTADLCISCTYGGSSRAKDAKPFSIGSTPSSQGACSHHSRPKGRRRILVVAHETALLAFQVIKKAGWLEPLLLRIGWLLLPPLDHWVHITLVELWHSKRFVPLHPTTTSILWSLPIWLIFGTGPHSVRFGCYHQHPCSYDVEPSVVLSNARGGSISRGDVTHE